MQATASADFGGLVAIGRVTSVEVPPLIAAGVHDRGLAAGGSHDRGLAGKGADVRILAATGRHPT
jgi:hypothetical protein